MTIRPHLALACFAAAAAWPTLVGELANALISPLQRALAASWCGMPLHSASAISGHCAACWLGASMLAALGVWLLAQPTPALTRAR